MSDSVRPHRRQPTRLPRPWDSPGKNTGVGCHCLLQCRKVKSESEVTESCLTLSDPMDCGPPGSSLHGIFQARVLEWGRQLQKEKTVLTKCYIKRLKIYGNSWVVQWLGCCTSTAGGIGWILGLIWDLCHVAQPKKKIIKIISIGKHQ